MVWAALYDKKYDRMKIVADENMPLVREMFSPYGEVVTYPGRELTAEHVWDADALLVRSVTLVNSGLLEGSRVKFVGSATIGVDHVDQQYLDQRKIHFSNAPGCNASSVVQYVLSVLFTLRSDWMGQTVGIVGCGNVGGRLYRVLTELGVSCRCYDPFLTKAKIPDLVSFEDVLQSDVLCLHTPLTTKGTFPTYHLFDEEALAQLSPKALLINAGRGAVVDNTALLRLLPNKLWQVALDVWEQEPDITLPLLEQVNIGTPHIAGYSHDGKVNGTGMIRNAFCTWQGLGVPEMDLSLDQPVQVTASSLAQAVLATYNVVEEDQRMRKALLAESANNPSVFDRLRKTYPQRLEFQHYRIGPTPSEELSRQLSVLGFS
jgi:erythronate-4-phosphate dehydrogenase